MTEGALVVTGGAGGIGLACAKTMASDHSAVALLDIDERALQVACKRISRRSVQTEAFPCDVTDISVVMAVSDEIERKLGPVRTLVTAAGILEKSGPVLGIDLVEHKRIWDINYLGTLHVVRAFARAMVKRRMGTILTVGSITGSGPYPLPAYSPSKAAIERLTQILAVELGRYQIRVNGIAPSYVPTAPILRQSEAPIVDAGFLRKAGALDMIIYPGHVADVAAFLCSPKAEAVTGVMLPIDAGLRAATFYRSFAGGMPKDAD
jgi:NAD(P)-dependent dehydrogenase (short-subunit alcohol dehydrogenase family)